MGKLAACSAGDERRIGRVMKVVYFAHDLTDAAVARRVLMLRMGGADIKLLGFRRSHSQVHEVEGVAAIDLGQTVDRRLASRAIQVVRRSLDAAKWRMIVSDADVVLARNLEMATIAYAARLWAGSRVRLAYECLDIHSAQLGKGIASKLLCNWEKCILRASTSLIISSPSFLTNYFETLDVALPEVILVENKRVLTDANDRPSVVASNRHPPWRIGWFGVLRCVESFHILFDLAQRRPTLVDVVLRGRPNPEMQSLISKHLPRAHMRFIGPYSQSDLASIYGACDFTWAVEYVGQNTQNPGWALGNRLYEGGFYNSPAIVLEDTAMGAWLKSRHAGVRLKDPHVDLDGFLGNLSPDEYGALQRSSAAISTRDLVWTSEDCHDFVRRIAD